MFKKPFSVLAAFALGLVISVSIMACADDLQEIVNCNCNDTVKELLTRIEELEKQVKELKEPDYDALAQIIKDRIDIDSSTPNDDEERFAAIEQEVAQLKNASTMENIGSYSWGKFDNTVFEYDNLNRIIKATNTTVDSYAGTEVATWTCTYDNNVCHINVNYTGPNESGNDSFSFTLADEQSRNFNAIKQLIYTWANDIL